ncbi:hypothetical protein OG859_18620 [Streptomyces sp. NBC_00048]|uniref:hypothetical protein n=1 Tax=Streptomyces sp. NBC_00048 TaxID=2975628 RepID=UPI00324824B2
MTLAEAALIFAMASNVCTAIGVIVATQTLKRGGPQVVISSGTAGEETYIAVGNVGRQSVSVQGYGLATVKRRRRKGVRFLRPYGVRPLVRKEAGRVPELWKDLDPAISLGPGESKVWKLAWPGGEIEAQVEGLLSNSPIKRKTVTGPADSYVHAVVKTFAAYEYCQIKVDPPGTIYVDEGTGVDAPTSTPDGDPE